MTRIVSREDTDALVRDTEIAIDLGRDLMEWWADRADDLKLFQIPLRDNNLVEVRAFNDTMHNNSQEMSVMGCLQTARFSLQRESSADDTPLEAFLEAKYALNARWLRRDGSPAGFGYDALIYKLKESAEVKRFVNGTDASALDFSSVGSVYEWLMLRVDIYDFLRATPLKLLARPLSRYLKEAAYVVCHEMFAAPIGKPTPGTLAECVFGYSFLPCACVASPFGFGPGHFKAAIKQFRFSLLDSGELEIKLSFIVAPRSEKVLDLWGFDPVYATFHLLDALTLGRLRIKTWAHNALDKNFMTVHGVVHHSLLNGMQDFWTKHRWVPG